MGKENHSSGEDESTTNDLSTQYQFPDFVVGTGKT
jgi:hypothetical protein